MVNRVGNYATNFLNKIVHIKIYRPIGSKHPKYKFLYEVNYGFVLHTKAPDGEEVDAYLLGINYPVDDFVGRCVAVIHRMNDEDDKLVVVPDGFKELKNEEILEMVNFQEKWFDSVVIKKL